MAICLMLTVLAVFPSASQVYGAGTVRLGNSNVEQWTSVIGGDMVQAYTLITVGKPTVIQSVSMFLQYSGSDGTQCMKFGIYMDNGAGSPAGQQLVAATQREYCLHGTGTWGPAWQTWNLNPLDYLTINTPGDYWLCTLAKQTYGSIYHYAYAGAYDYTYGYASYYFPSPYANGFPQFFASDSTVGLGWEANGPYSFYVTGT